KGESPFRPNANPHTSNFQKGSEEVDDELMRIMNQSFDRVVHKAKLAKVSHRTAATMLGVERVLSIRKSRGLYP
ncbi:hypothetical protein, partial [Tanticharoenia sakaeratensis]